MQPTIDVHHHFMPDAYIQAWGMEKLGSISAAGKVANWSPELSLELMEVSNTQAAVLSISSPGWPESNADSRHALCRHCNEFSAALVQRYPGRFGMYVNLPLPDIDRSLQEIEHGLDQLQADGVAVWTNYNGLYWGDPAFKPIFELLNARRAVVFVHPITPPGGKSIQVVSESTLDYPFETTGAIAHLLAHGIPEQYPEISVIFTHAGGVAPYLAGRIATFSELSPTFVQKGFDKVIPAMRRFFYDVTQSANQVTMTALRELVADSQLLYGSDVPFARRRQIELTVEHLPTLGIPEEGFAQLALSNAAKLFPALVQRISKANT
jgi:6-methylsalicylate decarboxylase